MKNKKRKINHSLVLFTICMCFIFTFNLGSEVSKDDEVRFYNYTDLRLNTQEIKRGLNVSHYTNYVCLTFDDGPDPIYTPAIVKELNKRSERATFFLIGKYIQNLPLVTKLLLDGDHEVGNHTWSHVKLSQQGLSTASQQLIKTKNVINSNFGYEPLWYRPPYGLTNSSINELALNNDMKLMMWDVDTSDYLNPSVNTLINRVTRKAYNGSIVLMHSNKANTNRALPRILDWFEKNHYLLVTASEWYELKVNHKTIDDILLSRLGFDLVEIPLSHSNVDEVVEYSIDPSTNPDELIGQQTDKLVNEDYSKQLMVEDES